MDIGKVGAPGKKLVREQKLLWAYSIAVERFHGMEQVGVRLPVGPHALVVQWIEQIRPKDKMGVRFSLGAPLRKSLPS